MSLEKSTPYRNAWYRDLLEKEAELKQYTDDKVAQAIELPEVTSEDNGDLLAADDGSWVKSDKLKTIMNADVEQVGKIPMVGAQGTWTLTDYPSNELPSVTSADNGKVAGVVNGNWDTMNIPNELPTVTGADDGKVLGVTSGAWGTMDILNNGAEVFDIDNNRFLLNNKKIADVVSAITSGSEVIIRQDSLLFRLIYTPTSNFNNYYFIGLIRPNVYNHGIVTKMIYCSATPASSDNRFTLDVDHIIPPAPLVSVKRVLYTENYTYYWGNIPTELPTVSAADNGSVLKVVNGQWAVGQVASSPIPISSSNSINAITVEGSLL